MLNKKIGTMVTLSALGLSLGTPFSVLATEYLDAQNAISPAVANIVAPEEITIPPVDPENPALPIDPTNPGLGDGLSLMYVSSLDFGEIEFKLNESQLINAQKDFGRIDEEEVRFDNMVSVMDIRGSREDGWDLRVLQTEELFGGAQITMNPKVNENIFGVSIFNETIILNNATTSFANADGTGEAGVISIGMGEVVLAVPAGTGMGEYQTTLEWQLVSEPQG